ncbi:MAG: putative LPS assembly protein LptD [Victivallales bacterium]
MGRKGKITLLCFAVLFALALMVSSLPEADAADVLSSIMKEDVNATANKLEFQGNNIIGNGNVRLRYKELFITCDKIIVNVSTKDVEAVGNVKLIRRVAGQSQVTADELKKLQDDPKVKVTVESYVNKPSGKQGILVRTITEKLDWRGEKAVGNLTTGVFDLGKYEGSVGLYYFKGESAEREADGSITIYNAEMTSCEYIAEDHEHYSVTASKIRLIPQEGFSDLTNKGSRDVGRYDIWAYWCWVKIGGVPVLPLPFVYKPTDSSGWGWQIRGGHDSDWGYFIQTRKRFIIYDNPHIETGLYLDYYMKRGPGGGLDLDIATEKTKTYGFAYGLYDQDPYKAAPTNQRFDIDKGRYDLKLNNLSHITPRMDFRGQIEKLSDANFLYDFFRDRYNDDPQPPSFASLDYQFNRFTASVDYRQRINSFFTEVQRLPEGRIDIPRQELFNSNIYYQGENSAGYFWMKWRDYDDSRTMGNGVDPKDYKAFRFDSLHMFYYPLQVDWLNILPRAGVRLTYYSKTSKTKVDPNDLNTMFTVDNPQGTQTGGDVVNYDDKGGEKLRVAAETGVEMNTKIYRTWNDAKSAFWDIDGIRHVMVPYLNYNFIPEPTLSRDKIYYFDDIDRIDEQNFIRLGLKNRLQTRRGDYNREEIYTWASIENYFDFHFNKEQDTKGKNFTNLGDFGTKIELDPFNDLHLASQLLINSGTFTLNKFMIGLTYDITDEWKASLGYNYQDKYTQRSTYSMGSSLADINSGSAFIANYAKFQSIRGKLEFPIMPKMRGEVEISYDIDNHMIQDSMLRIIRTFHCWELALEYGIRQNNNDSDSKETKNTVGIMLYLTAAPSAKIMARQSASPGGGSNSGGQ